MGGVLSYLVPGLGQIVQGRVSKGILFLLCIYTLYFYGLFLGAAEANVYGRTYRVSGNVYLPQKWYEAEKQIQNESLGGRAIRYLKLVAAYPRPQVAAQFFVGVAFWPAIIQYWDEKAKTQDGRDRPADKLDGEITDKYVMAERQRAEGQKEDADATLADAHKLEEDAKKSRHPILGDFMREPTMQATNAVFNGGDKRLEIAWVFTVIAGVLNVMVIWDALAGPAYTSPEDAKRKAG